MRKLFIRLHRLFRVFVLSILCWWSVIEVRAVTTQPVNVVDVLVLYTPQALSVAGSTNIIVNNIDCALFEANSVMQNSHANVRFRLVHTAEIAYTESGSELIDLTNLSDPGNIDLGLPAANLRDKYAADLVCLVTGTDTDYDFYGFQGPSASNAFSIIGQQYLVGQNYFPVALSYNFGCQNDWSSPRPSS